MNQRTVTNKSERKRSAAPDSSRQALWLASIQFQYSYMCKLYEYLYEYFAIKLQCFYSHNPRLCHQCYIVVFETAEQWNTVCRYRPQALFWTGKGVYMKVGGASGHTHLLHHLGPVAVRMCLTVSTKFSWKFALEICFGPPKGTQKHLFWPDFPHITCVSFCKFRLNYIISNYKLLWNVFWKAAYNFFFF